MAVHVIVLRAPFSAVPGSMPESVPKWGSLKPGTKKLPRSRRLHHRVSLPLLPARPTKPIRTWLYAYPGVSPASLAIASRLAFICFKIANALIIRIAGRLPASATDVLNAYANEGEVTSTCNYISGAGATMRTDVVFARQGVCRFCEMLWTRPAPSVL